MRRTRARFALLTAALALVTAAAGASGATGSRADGTSTSPAPGTAAYEQRDLQNMIAAYGRQYGPHGQLTLTYLKSLVATSAATYAADMTAQLARLNRLDLTADVVPGVDDPNPLRDGWDGTRGVMTPFSFTARDGALLTGDVFTPLPGAHDPYTGAALRGPYPGVVIEPGSVQGSERMYWWLAEDLAERGYVALVYDVQGQGRSETLPHQSPDPDLPSCDPLAPPAFDQETGCPGVPFQQEATFIDDLEDAVSFMVSRPAAPYPNPQAGTTAVSAYNPQWSQLDHTPDTRTVTPGRTSRIAIVGHSMAALAASYVQGVDPLVEAAVALDKLSDGHIAQTVPPGATQLAGANEPDVTPVVPSLGIQSDYGFQVAPYPFADDSSFVPQPVPPGQAPDQTREEKTGFDAWSAAGVDSMVVVPRASTHFDYSDVPYAVPASRYGQDLASVMVQAWLGAYLKHDPTADTALAASSWTYLEPQGNGKWVPVTLTKAADFSYAFCSGVDRHTVTGTHVRNLDLSGVGGC